MFYGFRRFGRQIFGLYEKHPIKMNSIVGSVVYIAGELTVQTKTKDIRFLKLADFRKVAEIGTLGAVENGLLMLKW